MTDLPSADDFRSALRDRFQVAEAAGEPYVIVNAGELHRALGGYPAKDGKHRMPLCCREMYAQQKAGDTILNAPPKGQGASLEIRFMLPR